MSGQDQTTTPSSLAAAPPAVAVPPPSSESRVSTPSSIQLGLPPLAATSDAAAEATPPAPVTATAPPPVPAAAAAATAPQDPSIKAQLSLTTKPSANSDLSKQQDSITSASSVGSASPSAAAPTSSNTPVKPQATATPAAAAAAKKPPSGNSSCFGKLCSCFGCGAAKEGPEDIRQTGRLPPPKPDHTWYGPWLRFNGYDPKTHIWTGSVLILTNQTRCPNPPTLELEYDQHKPDEPAKPAAADAAASAVLPATTTAEGSAGPTEGPAGVPPPARSAVSDVITGMVRDVADEVAEAMDDLGDVIEDLVTPDIELTVTGKKLDSHEQWNFWRFDLTLPLGPEPTEVQYTILPGTGHVTVEKLKGKLGYWTFWLPSKTQTWRWAFNSCNGFHEEEAEREGGGIQPLWKDVVHQHHDNPFHVMLGGGDQLYNDPVWTMPALVRWCQLVDAKGRLAHPFTREMEEEVVDYYFRAYLNHWREPVYRTALATIPQVMVWDDHDIFDGWGSYPDDLQNCEVFKGVYRIARRMYALWQHHAPEDQAKAMNSYFGCGTDWHALLQLGATTAVLVTDSRSERTDKQIIRSDSWDMIQHKLERLPASVRHCVVLTTVPVIYPKIPGVEQLLQALQGDKAGKLSAAQLLNKTGLADSLMSQFGTIEILDDLVDHWGADVHDKEKAKVVHMLQDLGQRKGIRFTLLSGDVHVGALGRFISTPDQNLPLRNDHRYIPQVISSAIGNLPPPDGVVKTLSKVAAPVKFDKETTEEMVVGLFGPNQILMGQRNWLVAEEPSVAPEGQEQGALFFQYRVEIPKKRLQKLREALPDALHFRHRPSTYDLYVPPLDPMPTQLPMGAVQARSVTHDVKPMNPAEYAEVQRQEHEKRASQSGAQQLFCGCL